MGLITAGGYWNIAITLLGVIAFAFNARQLRSPQRDDRVALLGTIALIPLVSMLGYGLGMWHAVGIVDQHTPTEATAVMAIAQGYASTVLAWGGLMAAANTLLATVALQRRAKL